MAAFSDPRMPPDSPPAVPLSPVIILVEPQLGENIGTAARAMANFGLAELRLVNPRDGWPNERARAAASRADHVIDRARVFGNTEEAVADLRFLYATTARPREVAKRVAGPDEAGRTLRRLAAAGTAAGILFGRERVGLLNEEVALADEILTFPVDPAFASLNVAQAVLLVAYEWRRSPGAAEGADLPFSGAEAQPPAPKEDLLRLFDHFESALAEAGFFRPPEKRPHMSLALRALLQRARLSEQEVRTLRGAIAALERRPTRPHLLPDGSLTTRRGEK
jgi:tRNA/rRNA methyltransferase